MLDRNDIDGIAELIRLAARTMRPDAPRLTSAEAWAVRRWATGYGPDGLLDFLTPAEQAQRELEIARVRTGQAEIRIWQDEVVLVPADTASDRAPVGAAEGATA